MKVTFALFLTFIPLTLPFSPLSLQIKFVKYKLFQLFDNYNSDTECFTDLKTLVSELENFQLWAMKMIDASTKIHPGLLEGTLLHPGNYDQCVNIEQAVNGRTIKGQSCAVTVIMDEENVVNVLSFFNLTQLTKKYKSFMDLVRPSYFIKNAVGGFEICVPNSCSVNDLEYLFNSIGKALKLPAKFILREELCNYKGKPTVIQDVDYFVFYFFATVAALVTASTIYDTYLRFNGRSPDVFTIFSVYSNTLKLLSTRRRADNTLTCLDGIKVLSCFWIMLGHLSFFSILASRNLIYLGTEWNRSWNGAAFFFAAVLCVTTFFCITGFLVTYFYLCYSEKKSVNLLSFYFVRLARLWPALFVMILIHTSILKHLVDGPAGPGLTDVLLKMCNTWWRDLLFVNNYSRHEDQCIRHAWYLSVDLQLYLCAPLILFYLRRHGKRTVRGMFIAFLVCVIFNFAITIIKKLPSSLASANGLYLNFYRSPVYHAPSWLIGIFFGYLFYCQKEDQKIKIPKLLNLILWIISLCIMGILASKHVDNENSVIGSALWNSLTLPTWSLAVCFIIFSCATGHGGCVNTFLSYPGFKILSKLSYSIFLVHPAILFILIGSSKQLSTFSNFNLLWNCWGFFIIVIPSSFVLYLIAEAPIEACRMYMEDEKNIIKKSQEVIDLYKTK